VAAQLVALVAQLQAKNPCGEKIYVGGFSNGTSIIGIALELGMKVDGVAFLGAAMHQNEDLTAEMKGTPRLTNFNSPSDDVANFANGMGRHGMNETGTNLNNSLPGVKDETAFGMVHLNSQGQIGGDVHRKAKIGNELIPWTSYFSGYALLGQLFESGKGTCLSKGTTLNEPGGGKITTKIGYQVFKTGVKK
jgi:hypothetical protein